MLTLGIMVEGYAENPQNIPRSQAHLTSGERSTLIAASRMKEKEQTKGRRHITVMPAPEGCRIRASAEVRRKAMGLRSGAECLPSSPTVTE